MQATDDMARLFPFRSETPAQEGPPRVVDLEGEDADAVFSALSSTTAREIYARLDEEPGTPSDVADAIDSSIQNVRYHLENLEDAGLVEVVDTWYSSRGNEMSVYATTNGPLIVTSDESTGAQLKTAISRLIGAIGALAGGSLLVQYGAVRWFGAAGLGASEDAAPAGASGGVDEWARAPPEETADSDGDAGVSAFDEGDEAPEEADEAEAAEDAPEDDADAESMDDAGGDADQAGDEPAPEMDRVEDTDAPADGGDPDGVDWVVDGVYDVLDGAFDLLEAFFSLSSPGMLFFLGGLLVLLGVALYRYLTVYRHRSTA